MDRSSKLRSCFVVFNNPKEIITYKHSEEDGSILRDADGKMIVTKREPSKFANMTEEEICRTVVTSWCNTKEGRTAAATYCISAEGLHHIHLVAECPRTDSFRYSAIQDILGVKAHCEPTRGNKQQADDYINKRGKYEEKGEIIVAKYQEGEIQGTQGNRSDIEAVEIMIQQGMTPSQIFDESIRYRRYEKMVKDAFFAYRSKTTPVVRDVKVYWHVGESGSGKSWSYTKLVEQYGEDDVYLLNDYDGGGFDGYSAQKILFMDEFKGQMKYGTLLNLLDKYKVQVHARYANALALWTEVHITSVYTPEQVYKNLCIDDRNTDSVKQLLRRLTAVVYHYKHNDNYESIEVPMSEYNGLFSLQTKARIMSELPY